VGHRIVSVHGGRIVFLMVDNLSLMHQWVPTVREEPLYCTGLVGSMSSRLHFGAGAE
jgi:hypothetical protein